MGMYEDLKGGSGHTTNFRAHRYDAKKLFGGLQPATDIGDIPHQLCNVSMSGLAAITSETYDPPRIGQSVPVRFRIDNTPLHEGMGEIVRAEPGFAGHKIGIRFVGGHLDIPALIASHKEQALKRELIEQLSPARVDIDPDYKLACINFLDLLRRYRRILDDWPEDSSLSSGAGLSDQEVINLCFDRLRPQWHAFERETNAYIQSILNQPEELAAVKSFTESVVTPELIHGPIWHQAYTKPFGYPGDHLVMDYVYSWKDEGETLYAKLVHRLGLDTLECVATRMTMVQQKIGQELNRFEGNRAMRITNLACGTAQEIVNILKVPELQTSVCFSLIDQDERALKRAYDGAYPSVARQSRNVDLNLYQSSFTDLMKGGKLSRDLPSQDMIYTIGLFDYLKDRRCQKLTRSLYDKLRPGGLLLIGNIKRSSDSGIWGAEIGVDWSMYYRTEDEMRKMVEGLPHESLEIQTDRTNRIYLLALRKPQTSGMI